jgi:hypothetical protein
MLMDVRTRRQSITMWALLVWAYKRQMVRYEVDRAARPCGAGRALLAEFLRQRSGFAAERGCINGAGTTAHDDAHVVHAHVQALGSRERELIMATAEAGRPPEWNPAIPAFRVVPKRRAGNGAVQRIWSPSGNAVGCLIEYVGVPDHEAALIRRKARELYELWWRTLRRLRSALWVENSLTLWKVSQTGAPAEPWIGSY